MVGLDPLCWFTWHSFSRYLGLYMVLFGYGREAIWGYTTYSSTQQSFCHHLQVFWKERRSTIDYPIFPGDDYEWSTFEFKEWRATRYLCFIIDLLVPNPLDPCLSADILRDYTLKFEARVKSILRDLKECLTKAIRDMDCYKEAFIANVEDFNEMGRT